METQGAQIFHKLSPHLTPSKLKTILKGNHRRRLDQYEKDKLRRILIQHPSPCSFGCIDLVFGITNDWSPFFNESVSVYLNRLTQLLVKGFIIYCLFALCDYFPEIIGNYKSKLQTINKNCDDRKPEIRKEFIEGLAKIYTDRFSGLNMYETLMSISKKFESSIRWYLALGFIPVRVRKKIDIKEMIKSAMQSLQKSNYERDNIQEFLASYFTVIKFSLNHFDILSPYQVKHQVIITSRDGVYNATTYDGEDIELLSFNEIVPDITSNRISLAASMLSHEYLYLYAHVTNAIQTTQKLRQSTIVVSSEPAFSINTKGSNRDEIKKSLTSGLDAIAEIQSLYGKLSEETKKELQFNPTAMTILDSEVPTRSQVRVLQEMYDQLRDKALNSTLHDEDSFDNEEESDRTTRSIIDVHDDPLTNTHKSLQTVQDIQKKTQLKDMKQHLMHAVQNVNNLRNKLRKHIEKSACDNLMISILKMEKEEDKKALNKKDKDIAKLQKSNGDLLTRVNNMVSVIDDLTKHVTSTDKENDDLLNMITKGKALSENINCDEQDLAWNITAEKRTEIVNSLLNLINFGGNQKEFSDAQNTSNICQQFESVLIGLKMEVVPLFHKVQNKQQLDLFNSWVTKQMRDKNSSFIESFNENSQNEDEDNNLIEIYETQFLKVIDVNPITSQERARVTKIAENTSDGSLIGATGTGGTLFTKKFFNIQFPQTGNVKGAIDNGLEEMWSQVIKTVFMIGAPMYTVTGQQTLARETQGTFEKFHIPFLTLILGTEEYILPTVALLMKIENTQMFEHGAKDINTFLFDDTFYYFWDNRI